MALKAYDGATWDTLLVGTETVSSANTSLTTTYIAGADQTAPNTSNKVTGVIFYLATVPSSGNLQIEVRESGVSKVSGVANNADLQLGWNYIRFTTPYQFTTTSANAYTPYIKNTAANTGSVMRSNTVTKPSLIMTYDTATTLGATDDVFVCGFHDSGLTTKTLNLTGTSNSWGDGADKNTSTTSARSFGMATNIGNGGTIKFDTTAACKLTQLGSLLVTAGGLFDMRPGSSYVNTLEFNNDTADGNYGIITAAGSYGGQVLTTGNTVSVVNTFASGLGTAASPIITQTAHGFAVNDELVFGGASDYLKNEVRYVKSIPSATQLVLSSTVGGAEAALAQTHAVGSHIGNMTRNSIIKNTNTARGFTIFNNSAATTVCDFSYTRMEYPNCLSGKALQLSSTGHAVVIDGLVVYHNSAAGRSSIQISGLIEQTFSDIILFDTRGTNYSAQSGFALAGATNKTVDGLYHFAEPASTTNCAALSISNTSTSNVIRDAHSYGANAVNGTGYAFGVYGSGNTFENCSANAARRQAIILDAGTLNTFTNCHFGVIANNTIDVTITSAVLVQALFQDCTCSSTTRISNYTNALPGSDVAFQNLDGNSSKHCWYSDKGSFASAGSGLTDTTVRTAGSLSLAIKPENATSGGQVFFKVPANPTSNVLVFGYLYRNATFSSGDLTVDLFLPGTLLTDTPDDTVTLATTTGSWLPFTLNAYYSSTDSRYATVRITAKTATAGAYAFLDDLYDAGTANKVAGLDLWDEGHISPVIVAADYSAIPQTTRLAVWSDTDTYSTGEKGYIPDQLDSIASEQILPNLLIKDKLS